VLAQASCMSLLGIFHSILFYRHWQANNHNGASYGQQTPRASISQDYWGDIKENWGSGERKSPAESRGLFVKLHIIFAFKYNKQQLLLLLDKISLAAKIHLKHIFNFSTSKIMGDITMDVPTFINIGGHVPLSHRDRRPWQTHNYDILCHKYYKT